MEESHQEEELEDVIARRIITQAETEEFGDANPAVKKAEDLVKRGGDAEEFSPTETALATAIETDERNETAEVTVATEAAPPTVFTKIEKSLASLGFFTPSSRRLKEQKIKRINFTREIAGKRVEVTAEIIPSAMFGLPVTADQDKYLALQKIVTNILHTEGEVKNPVKFRSADLLRLLNRSTKTGKNYKEIGEWLDVMMSTTIFSQGVVYKAGEKRFAKDRFRVFDRAISVGKELEDGTIADANYIWLSDWQLQNINNNFLLPIDLETYRELKNHIAKALVPLLQIWLFASQKAGSFEKRYDELCEILTLQRYPSPSQILRQLKPSLDELTHYGYLEKWRIEKTSTKKAYKIVFFHGPKFHRDRRRRLEQKSQTDAPVIVAQSEPLEELELPQPGKLEASTVTAIAPEPESLSIRTGPPDKNATTSSPATPASFPPAGQSENDLEASLIDELSTRGIMPSVAMKLLKPIPPDRLEQVGDYIDYWDTVKRSKDVGEGLLYTLIREGNPLPAKFETRRQRREREAIEKRRQNLQLIKDILTSAYEEHRRTGIDRFIAEQIPPEEFERRVAEKKTDLAKQSEFNFWKRPGSLDEAASHAVRAEIAQGVMVTPFENFRRQELPRILAELKLDAKELGIERFTDQTSS